MASTKLWYASLSVQRECSRHHCSNAKCNSTYRAYIHSISGHWSALQKPTHPTTTRTHQSNPSLPAIDGQTDTPWGMSSPEEPVLPVSPAHLHPLHEVPGHWLKVAHQTTGKGDQRLNWFEYHHL